VLQSRYRPAWTPVPKSVTITVGRKADVLYFLHSGAWLFGDVLQWSYVLTYADGTTERIPVIAGVNVRDWGRANVKEFDDPPGMRTTVAPEHVANTLAPTCGMYITEWLNPHPEADIKEIEMLSAGEGVPILLAITGGVKRGT
jgi:hypothetical protein